MRLSRFLVLVVVSALSVASAAHAQSARELVDEGVAARRQQNDEEALALFVRAYGIDSSGEARAQMALAEQALGRWADAYLHLQDALAQNVDPWVVGHRAALESSLAEISSHVGRLTVVSNVETGEVFIEGRRVGDLPMAEPIVVEAGSVIIEVRSEGYEPRRREIDAAANMLTRTTVNLVASLTREPVPIETDPRNEDDPPHRVAPPPAETSPFLYVGIASAGLAVLSAVALVAGLAVREENVLTWNDEAMCPSTGAMGRRTDCEDEYQAIGASETAAIIGGIAAGTFAVASAIFFALAADGDGEEQAINILPDVGSTHAAVQLLGSF